MTFVLSAPTLCTARRVAGWRTRLHMTLAAIQRKSFEWSEHDCAVGLAGPVVEALTGIDLTEQYRGSYHSARGALKRLRSDGFNDLVDMAAHYFPEIHPAFARVGDLVAIRASETGWALGVVMGERLGVLAPDGFATLERTDAVRAFKVG